jgi:hypothetical protein
MPRGERYINNRINKESNFFAQMIQHSAWSCTAVIGATMTHVAKRVDDGPLPRFGANTIYDIHICQDNCKTTEAALVLIGAVLFGKRGGQ